MDFPWQSGGNHQVGDYELVQLLMRPDRQPLD
jgi:hypothetical protein